MKKRLKEVESTPNRLAQCSFITMACRVEPEACGEMGPDWKGVRDPNAGLRLSCSSSSITRLEGALEENSPLSLRFSVI